MALILHCIVPDQETFVSTLVGESWVLGVLVLIFILLGSLTVMNMLLGVLVEAVKMVSNIEREQMMAEFAKKAALSELSCGTEGYSWNRIEIWPLFALVSGLEVGFYRCLPFF